MCCVLRRGTREPGTLQRKTRGRDKWESSPRSGGQEAIGQETTHVTGGGAGLEGR